MREIKFRVYSKQYGMSPACSIFDIQIMDAEGLTNMDEIEIMQYTGLKDKNGKEIYEGDILRLWRSESILGELRGEYYKLLVVEYSDLWCQFVVEDKQNKNTYGIWPQFDKFEVIGNIYSNPELLKESECDNTETDGKEWGNHYKQRFERMV